MKVEQIMRARLASAFPTARIELVNDSASHAGHAGDDGSGESHWQLRLASPELMELGRLARHRAVHAALGPEVMGRIHALSLDVTG